MERHRTEQEIELVKWRLGPITPFVFAAPRQVPVREQGARLFATVAAVMSTAGAWLVEETTAATTPDGFGALMEKRERGQLAWDAIYPVAPASTFHPRIAAKRPYAMLARAEYPCWAGDRRTYTIDLFNAANELMFPYEDDHRLWALIPSPPHFPVTDPLWLALVKAAAVVLRADIAFGGPWVASAATAYGNPRHFNALDESTRLETLVYPHMVLKADRLSHSIERLRDPVTPNSVQQFEHTVCELFDDGGYLVISMAPDYLDDNVHLGRAAAKILERRYVTDVLLRGSPKAD